MANKEKKMTPKWFLHKASTKAANSAIAFIAAHREFLETGELAEVTSPILRLLDEKQVLPTPALALITQAVLSHMLAVEVAKADRQIRDQMRAEESGEAKGFRTRKDWLAVIKDAQGNIVETENTVGDLKELQQGFDMAAQAERWVDRRLFDGAPDWYGEVSHTTLTSAKDGLPLTIRVERSDAIARILKKPKGPTVHRRAQSTAKLSFGVKIRESRSTFSHG